MLIEGEEVLHAPGGAASYTLGATSRGRSDRAEIETLRTITQDSRLEHLFALVSSIRVHTGWWIPDVVRPGSSDEGNKEPRSTGRNLLQVLQAWKKAPRRNRNQFQWVIEAAQRAFPDVIADLEFDDEGGGAFLISARQPGAQRRAAAPPCTRWPSSRPAGAVCRGRRPRWRNSPALGSFNVVRYDKGVQDAIAR